MNSIRKNKLHIDTITCAEDKDISDKVNSISVAQEIVYTYFNPVKISQGETLSYDSVYTNTTLVDAYS